jgi:hypothetical protein
MMREPTNSDTALPEAAHVAALFEQYQLDIYRSTDRLFAGLMGFQWIAGIAFALWFSPLAWSGSVSRIHFLVERSASSRRCSGSCGRVTHRHGTRSPSRRC